MTNEEVLLKAAKLALLEFDRISYQIKADPIVLGCIRAAIARAERPLPTPREQLMGTSESPSEVL